MLDIATHPPDRVPLIKAALNARKHVLSQKPFVLDFDTGEKLADLADKKGVKLAVNQNGRWAPHFSYIRHAVQENLHRRFAIGPRARALGSHLDCGHAV